MVAAASVKMSLGIGRRPYSNGSRRVWSVIGSFGVTGDGGDDEGGASVFSAMEMEVGDKTEERERGGENVGFGSFNFFWRRVKMKFYEERESE